MLIPGALQSYMGMDAGDAVKLQVTDDVNNHVTNRYVIRALVNQMPGQQFTNYLSNLLIEINAGGPAITITIETF